MLVQLNAKVQLTVPQSIRRQLGLKAGDVLELETRGETIVVRPCASDVPVIRSVARPQVLGLTPENCRISVSCTELKQEQRTKVANFWSSWKGGYDDLNGAN